MLGRWSKSATSALIAGVAMVGLPLAVAGPAHAVDACTSRTLSQPFKQWGDSNNYFPVNNGTFESGTSGWNLGAGSSRVAENEPWKVGGAGSYSLKIGSGASVSTPVMCLTADEDSTRFFYKSPGPNATLTATITATVASAPTTTTSAKRSFAGYTAPTGSFTAPTGSFTPPSGTLPGSGASQSFTISFPLVSGAASGWQVSPQIKLPNLSGLTGTYNVQITLAAQGGPWQIDDIYVDPSRTR
jgi:hypothetical protein